MSKTSARTSKKSKPKPQAKSGFKKTQAMFYSYFSSFRKFKFNPNTKKKVKTLVSLTFILFGLFLLNTYIKINNPRQDLNFNISTKNKEIFIKKTGPIQVDSNLMKEGNVSEEPTRIVIPNAKIDINVIEAEIKDGYWEISDTTASHGMGSANPGQKGNSVIFAHARAGLFYNLKDLEKDDIVYVFTQKKWFPYKVTEIITVYPDQVEVIAPTKDQTLTLYTCSGYSDEKRLVITAKPLTIN